MRFCVQVKNKPCARRIGYKRLISWIHPHGSETASLPHVNDASHTPMSPHTNVIHEQEKDDIGITFIAVALIHYV
jgi:hypothetical protein